LQGYARKQVENSCETREQMCARSYGNI